jgi:two-component system cell cycle sensor histidine kinase/response regulator CckA
LGGPETLLLAEDDPQVRELHAEILREFGYRVIEAVDGLDALEKYAKHKTSIHLLILDVIMPRKNGITVYEEVKKVSPQVKALFTSGYPADLIRQKGVLAEGLHFITKPVSPPDLLRKIREILD